MCVNFLLLAVLLVFALPGRADTITTFQFTATIDDAFPGGAPPVPPGSGTGTVTIDTTTGVVTGANISLQIYNHFYFSEPVYTSTATLNTVTSQASYMDHYFNGLTDTVYDAFATDISFSGAGTYVADTFSLPANASMNLVLRGAGTLVGYTGGDFCIYQPFTEDFPCSFAGREVGGHPNSGIIFLNQGYYLTGGSLTPISSVVTVPPPDTAATPEPSSLLLLGSGLGLLAAARKRLR